MVKSETRLDPFICEPETRCSKKSEPEMSQTHNATFLATLRTTRFFWGVTYVATLHATVAEVELDPTSATIACNIARKVAPCVTFTQHHNPCGKFSFSSVLQLILD